jgi:hypothetical protein
MATHLVLEGAGLLIVEIRGHDLSVMSLGDHKIYRSLKTNLLNSI